AASGKVELVLVASVFSGNAEYQGAPGFFEERPDLLGNAEAINGDLARGIALCVEAHFPSSDEIIDPVIGPDADDLERAAGLLPVGQERHGAPIAHIVWQL